MSNKRQVEVFSAGCPICQDAIDLVKRLACPSCEITILDLNDAPVLKRANALGIKSVPAVVIDGELAECCSGVGINEASLKAAGIGEPLT